MKSNNATNFKEYLASEMAKIDVLNNFEDKTYEDHFNEFMQWRDFDLLHYWLRYNGVFDGGESMLDNLKIFINDYIKQNEKQNTNRCIREMD